MRVPGRSFAAFLVALHLPAAAAAQTGPEPPREPTAPPASPAPAAPGDKPPPSGEPTLTPEQRIEELERRLRVLEQQHGEAQTTEKTADKPSDRGGSSGVALPYSPEGAGVVSSDGKFQFRFRPIVQADARFFLNDGTNTFLMRRVRPAMEGTVFEYFDWRLMPELAGTPNVQDAYVNIRIWREIQLRAGKFKPPVGLERLLSDPDLPLLERGLPTNLVPDRDIGVQVHGDILGGTIVYAGGIFNGAGDGVNGDNDNNDKKDLAGRILLRPFQPTFVTALRKLGLGIAATRGTHVGLLPAYRTAVGTPFFVYGSDVTAGGTHRRLAPQMQFYVGPFGMFAEYTRSAQIVMAPTTSTSKLLTHEAWQVTASFFLTGEEASPGTVTPKRPLSPRTFGTGAVELAGRYGELYVDGDTFSWGLADPTRSAKKAVNWAVGINWHLARNFKWMLDYERTSFEGGSAAGDRPAESLILTRLQAAY
jgi:phosphate-selective porin OprO and OprP